MDAPQDKQITVHCPNDRCTNCGSGVRWTIRLKRVSTILQSTIKTTAECTNCGNQITHQQVELRLIGRLSQWIIWQIRSNQGPQQCGTQSPAAVNKASAFSSPISVPIIRSNTARSASKASPVVTS